MGLQGPGSLILTGALKPSSDGSLRTVDGAL